MTKLVKMGMVSALALATALPAAAQQPWRETPDSVAQRQQYEAQQQQYQDQQDQYRDQRDRYDARRDAYQDARDDYRAARADYDRRVADWEYARARYDARWGYGAYARRYARPVWDESRWAYSDRYDSYGADRYGRNASATVVPCNNNSAVGAGVIGAIAGAVLGSNIAARNARPEGAVLGGVVGAGLGAAVGHANDRYKCDSRGAYFAYGETVPYREGRDRYASAYDYGYYARQRCRLAPAPVDPYGRDIRYVRVCPDETGRYRITG